MVNKATIRSRLYFWNQDPNRPPHGYDQSNYHAGADGKRYRDDCSGYVSMLTGMTASPATATMTTTPSIAFRIKKEELTFGDVLMVGPKAGRGGHVVLFDSWTDASRTSYLGHDFGFGSEPHHRVLPYPYPDTRAFVPYRLTAVDQASTAPAKPVKPAPVKPAPAKPSKPATTPSTNTNAAPPFPGLTKIGSRGDAVKAVQLRLIARGWKISSATGYFGSETDRVVKAFQKEKKLEVDGKVGPLTWAALWIAPIT